jgi:hypothetical protein
MVEADGQSGAGASRRIRRYRPQDVLFGGFRLPDTGKPGWYPVANAWVFDDETQGWTALPPMPTASGALAAVAVGTKIYVIGGARIPPGADMPDGLYGSGPTELL